MRRSVEAGKPAEASVMSAFKLGFGAPVRWLRLSALVARMKVSVIFDPAFEATTGPGVWIVDTPDNRRWFDLQPELEAGSAIFRVDDHPDADMALVQVIRSAQEHLPAWQAIAVIGCRLTTAVSADLQGERLIASTTAGFELKKTQSRG